MPVVIEEMEVAVQLFNREIGPNADPVELGRKVAELEARIQTLETVIVVEPRAVTITAERVTIRGDSELLLQGSVNRIKLDSANVVIQVSGSFTVSAATCTFNSSMSTFSGIVKSETLMTTTVIAQVYTPGAGNVL